MLCSAKLAHSRRARFQLVTRTENLSVPLTRPFAPATMLKSRCSRSARLGLRTWATAPLRAFQSERQDIAATTFPHVSKSFFQSFSIYRPHQARFHRGPDVATFRGILPLAAPFRRLCTVKGDRPRTHSSKKRTMKTNTNSDSGLQNRTAQFISQKSALQRIDFA